MGKTALDLSIEELKTYQPYRKLEDVQNQEKWDVAWKVAQIVASTLKKKFKANRVMVFGSLVHKTSFTSWSDIDLIAFGIPVNKFYRAVAEITGLSSEFEIDLVDPETCHPKLLQLISSEGIEL